MKEITSKCEGDVLTVYIQCDIDHHSASGLRADIDRLIGEYLPARLVLDFDAVDFMDSSGIGLIMGRCKKMTEHGGELVVRAMRPRCRKIAELSGITRIVKIENA